MSLPDIAGHELQDLIGAGSCGAVYRAVTADGRGCAVKVFSSMAINRRALAATIRAMHHMPPHPGVLPVHEYSFDQSPYFCAMPLVGMLTKDGAGHRVWQTPSLESVCGRVSGDQAWRHIYEVSASLAWLHKHGITHGNLRPVNVLLEDDPDCATRLTDLGQGWVGGIHHLDFTDHFMHLYPDQVDDPDGVFSGQGFSWDVYSFGVLSYRLLTGQFPRAAAYWSEQMAHIRRQTDAGLAPQMDGEAIVAAVRAQPEVRWPEVMQSPVEERRREIIMRCLDFDTAARFRDMREVLREFEILESDFLLEDAEARVAKERAHQAARVKRLQIIGASLLSGLSVATALFGITWLRAKKAEDIIGTNAAAHEAEVRIREDHINALAAERDRALVAKNVSDANFQHSQNAVDQFLTQLFQTPTGSVMEAEFSRKQLDDALAYVMSTLPALEQAADLGAERSRAYGNIGRIHLHMHNEQEARDFLQKAKAETEKLIAEKKNESLMPQYRQWLGRHCLLLSEIAHREGRGQDAMTLLHDATGNLQAGLEADPKNRLARYESARAWLDFGLRSRLDGHLQEAMDAFGKLSAVLDAKLIGGELDTEEKFTLARGKFERALTERDAGKVDESIATLIEAVQEMGNLVLNTSPRNQDQALALAEAYTELAEIIGKHFSGTEAKEAHDQAVPVLLELNRLHPDWAEVKCLLARNYAALASLTRDSGGTAAAVKKKQDAIELMNEIVADNKQNARYIFHLAKLKGEYAELMCDLGRHKEAVPVARTGLEALVDLIGVAVPEKLTPEEKHRRIELAHLYGVLGHASESSGQKDSARESFNSAAAQWEKLAAMDANDDTIQQGLTWTKDRLAKMKK
jgi:eukaryotic-like serine/threonine-protein kinase